VEAGGLAQKKPNSTHFFHWKSLYQVRAMFDLKIFLFTQIIEKNMLPWQP
jgi:hypothetical protein